MTIKADFFGGNVIWLKDFVLIVEKKSHPT